MANLNSKYSNIIKKALFSTSCLVTLTTFTNVVSFGDMSQNQSYQVNAASTKPITAYTDYKANEYWASPMQWAVEKGIIKGYPEMNHPATGKYGSWLDPHGKLTEAQYLTMLFRMTEEDKVDSTLPQIDHWASVPYQLAKEYNLPVKGNLSNMNPSNSIVTRGEMARILASFHQGKQVSVQDAVSWMYNNNLALGYTDAAGNPPKTFASFGVNDQLTRAHVVSFLQRYDTFLANNGEPVALTNPTPQSPINTDGLPYTVVNGKNVFVNPWADNSLQPKKFEYHPLDKKETIYTEFGDTYALNTQKDYDQIMAFVKEGVRGYMDIDFADLIRASHPEDEFIEGYFQPFFDEYYQGVMDFFNGARYIGAPWDIKNDRDRALYDTEKRYGPLVNAGVTKEQALDLGKLKSISSELYRSGKNDPLERTPQSFYNAIFRMDEVVFNVAGYKTKVDMGSWTLSTVKTMVQVNGKWFYIRDYGELGGDFELVDESKTGSIY